VLYSQRTKNEVTKCLYSDRCICILLFTVTASVLNIFSLPLLFQIISMENGLFSVSILSDTVKPQGY